MKKLLIITLLITLNYFAPVLPQNLAYNQASATDDILPPKEQDWTFDGPLGKFDLVSIQKGFQVYREVCSVCHSLKRIAFRNLTEIGFSPDEVKALAAEYMIADGPNDDGEMFERPGRPSDYFPSPYANEKAARAANNNNALPPDLSLIVKARENGANYVYSLLTGYIDPPNFFQLGENMHYNPYFAGGGQQFSMIPPLTKPGQVAYLDNANPTVDEMAHDVVNFLQWAAEPEMEKRKSLGFKVISFLIIYTLVFYLLKRKVWKRVR